MLHLLDGKAGQQVTLGEFVDGMGARGFGFCLIVFGLLAAISLPGVGSVMGAPLLLFALQLMWGMKQPWVPKFLARRSISADGAKKTIERAHRWLKKIEIFAKPRVSWLTEGLIQRLVGLFCLLLAAVIVMPGPFTNNPPGMAITLLGFALAERDGVLMLIALLASVVAFVLGLSAFIAVALAVWAWASGYV
jgi:hypothetical protein